MTEQQERCLSRVGHRLQETSDSLREHIKHAQEPQLKAMLETSADVIRGLIETFKNYERKNEPAWW